MNLILMRTHGKGFRTLSGFILFLLGAILLGLGGYSSKSSRHEEHDFADKMLGLAGVILIILSFLAEAFMSV